MAYKKKSKTAKKKYSAAEKKAYYMGVGGFVTSLHPYQVARLFRGNDDVVQSYWKGRAKGNNFAEKQDYANDPFVPRRI